MKNKTVSIILPCYNVEKYVKATLDSLLNQTFKDFEIIAVNDGSTDKTLDILEGYSKKHPQIKLISQTNKGLSAARNVGLENSQGKYIAFVDSDDIVTSDYLQTLVENLEKYDADISICNFKRIKENKPLKRKQKDKIKIFLGQDCTKELFRQKTFDICVWNKLYKRDLLDDIRFNEQVYYAEDIAFNFLYFKKCNKAVFDELICYWYIRRSAGLVNTPISSKKLTSFNDVDLMIEESEKNEPEYLPYTKAWKTLVSLEFLYYCYKYKYQDKETVKKLISNMKENMPYLKQAKRMVWHRRHLVGIGYALARFLLRKDLK